jgi:uncharacterized RmlC-like cupin family protein/outer membrane lipoprotein SlyB
VPSTPGMDRKAAINFARVGAQKLWAGTVTIHANAKTGAHHHGPLESVIYVVRGRARMRWGDRLEFTAEAGPGDFIYVPPFVPHQEINASPTETLECVLCRSDGQAVAINLDIEPVEKPEQVLWVDPTHPHGGGVKDGQAPVATVTQKAPVRQAQVTQPGNVAPARTPVAQACANCGVVESAVAVQRQGQVNGIGNTGIGVGAVAGGLVGGLLGNQVGGGSGKTAATVLGAAGGAYAGHAIEKNSKKVTVYQMRIRMNDGTIRTVEQGSAIAAGSRVVVDGNTVRMAS